MLLQQIKTDQLIARKSRAAVKASLLTTLLGELNTLQINNGTVLTDADIFKVITKFLNGIEETLKLRPDTTDLIEEKNILLGYLPQQLSAEELAAAIQTAISALEQPVTIKSLGAIMKSLKISYPGQFDGGAATTLIKTLIG